MRGAIERVCLSVNSTCNLRCGYCYFFARSEDLPGPSALDEGEIGTILERIHEHCLRPETLKRVKVNFVGSGEPLLHWSAIHAAVSRFIESHPDHRLRFYTVTNGTLLTRKMVGEMKAIGLVPSVSLEGPASIHDQSRLDRAGRGSHATTMEGIALLRQAGMPVAINTTLRREVIDRLDEYFTFVATEGFEKVIFDRLVDVPADQSVEETDFYRALRRSAEIKRSMGLAHLEIGNLEAWRRALAGETDHVCTMFGSTCGAGFHNIIYMQREVYPCGRMFHDPRWRLGRFDESLESYRAKMAEVIGVQPDDDEAILGGRDCLIDGKGQVNRAREEFAAWYAGFLDERV